MAEVVTLDVPIATPAPTMSDIRVSMIHLDEDAEQATFRVRSSSGLQREYTYQGAEAVTMIRALNKANLSVKSLNRRILERLIADHPELSGTISGAPD